MHSHRLWAPILILHPRAHAHREGKCTHAHPCMGACIHAYVDRCRRRTSLHLSLHGIVSALLPTSFARCLSGYWRWRQRSLCWRPRDSVASLLRCVRSQAIRADADIGLVGSFQGEHDLMYPEPSHMQPVDSAPPLPADVRGGLPRIGAPCVVMGLPSALPFLTARGRFHIVAPLARCSGRRDWPVRVRLYRCPSFGRDSNLRERSSTLVEPARS